MVYDSIVSQGEGFPAEGACWKCWRCGLLRCAGRMAPYRCRTLSPSWIGILCHPKRMGPRLDRLLKGGWCSCWSGMPKTSNAGMNTVVMADLHGGFAASGVLGGKMRWNGVRDHGKTFAPNHGAYFGIFPGCCTVQVPPPKHEDGNRRRLCVRGVCITSIEARSWIHGFLINCRSFWDRPDAPRERS